MKITPQAIPDVLLIEPKRFGDARGFFSEVWKRSALAAQGFTVDFVQDNHSLSREVGVLRGLHFQRPPTPQGKLVRVVRGRILDVAVDIRQGSPTYGQHVACELSAENWCQLWVPRGFAHGFMTLEPDTEVLYKVDGEYDPATDAGIAWDDPALGIDWPLPAGGPILSDKDRKAPRLAEIPPPFPQGSL
ncbi:MAG: dTDP-4-dehydrorhamnose 3,5-epimerase [Roseomonas sp.]|nr:dTDP-4-dehydrorhamnose 3,5-epimerase [Roseomonas sp.]MCA3315386.1 dTDP-4-dehydrorhamnose 3,5-epimerase [Roseomonas sp.]MCA3343625.1 dTDP-4-dehydrorhamnose 3,5-epimerase [Roseomonas sp.]MCA3586296.1 dTDP-4-dehydrorhamnose 3,5-epimerase [Methylocystis sp.]MCA3653293.1 dTDP-4-dehydrorhamnose 3,5-epimerase [Methylobacterium sp.]